MKKILFILIFIFLITCSCLYPDIAFAASRQGVITWFQQILPALFPFTILSGILLRSKFMDSLSKSSNLFSILLTLICGFVFGFPIGAKLSADFYQHNLITRRQAIILAIAANNFSTMYVCGYVLPTLFQNNQYKMITYLILYLFPLLLSVILLLFTLQESPKEIQKNSASRFQLDMQIIDAGIISGFESLIKICGYIVMFSLISQMICHLWQNTSLPAILILGNLEITNGIQLLSQTDNLSIQSKYLIAIQLLAFGGISGLAQTASILKPSGLSIKYYVMGKILLSILSVLLLILCLNIYH